MQSNPVKVYAIVLKYPESNQVLLQDIPDFIEEGKTKVSLLGYKGELKVSGCLKKFRK